MLKRLCIFCNPVLHLAETFPLGHLIKLETTANPLVVFRFYTLLSIEIFLMKSFISILIIEYLRIRAPNCPIVSCRSFLIDIVCIILRETYAWKGGCSLYNAMKFEEIVTRTLLSDRNNTQSLFLKIMKDKVLIKYGTGWHIIYSWMISIRFCT